MSIMKSCSNCRRSYSDLSLSFCLEDGSLLPAPYNSEDFKSVLTNNIIGDDDEEDTLIKSSGNNRVDSEGYSDFVKNRELLSKKYRKTFRTQKEYPILNSKPTFKRPLAKWTSSDFITLITYDITGLHTFHAQENIVILREFLNEFIITRESKFLEESNMRLGVAYFYTRRGESFTYDFQKKHNPSKEDFLKVLNKFLNW